MSVVMTEPLTVGQIDNELAERARELDLITSTMLELDKHQGLVLIRRYPPSGQTEARWLSVRDALAVMWEDLGRLRTILESANTLRGRRSRVDDDDRAELTRLLRGRPLEAARTAIPLAERSLAGPSELVSFVGLADLVARMNASFPFVAEFLDAVDAVNSRVLAGSAPLQHELDAIGARVLSTESDGAGLRAIAEGIAELLRRSATDPLALSVGEIDRTLADLGAALRRESAALAELTALAADRAGAIDRLRARLDTLRTAVERAETARTHAENSIRTGPLPTRPDPRTALAARLAALAATPGALVAVRELASDIDAAIQAAEDDHELARGLLDRRAELRGRLGAYQAKAARLGVSADDSVRAANEAALQVLSHRPCDLVAATRVVAQYQRLIADISGRRR
ncbi:hypothetical protein [Nocardia callitridis]|uniref:MerR family transcriptional regulator n=1 Tax=Nocardia callitridis TaxID=648753 RepID=A0ABP9K5D8_9NOCA